MSALNKVGNGTFIPHLFFHFRPKDPLPKMPKLDDSCSKEAVVKALQETTARYIHFWFLVEIYSVKVIEVTLWKQSHFVIFT